MSKLFFQDESEKRQRLNLLITDKSSLKKPIKSIFQDEEN